MSDEREDEWGMTVSNSPDSHWGFVTIMSILLMLLIAAVLVFALFGVAA